MKTLLWIPVFAAFLSFLGSSVQAQEDPAAVYSEWVQAEKGKDLEKIRSLLASAAKAKMEEELKHGEKPELVAQMVQDMAPLSYKITNTVIAPDGMKASLFVDSIQKQFLTLDGQPRKKERVLGEVQLVKESGQWKISRECWGEGKCDAEPDWIASSYGKVNALPTNASVRVIKGKPEEFKAIPVSGKAFVVEVAFHMPEINSSLDYFLHQSPSFAEFFLSAGEKKITPTAAIDDFPGVDKDDPKAKEPKVLEPGTTYSHSRTFSGDGRISILFALPPDFKGSPSFKMSFTFNEKKYAYEIK